MIRTTPSNISGLWARAGAMFLAAPAAASPDLEELLLDTARHASENSRLFIMAATWLARHGRKVCGRRLARLIGDDLEPQFKPVMGLLLDCAQHLESNLAANFEAAIGLCQPAAEPRPLFDVEQRNQTLRCLAEQNASPLSRKWNLWAQNFEPKYDAIRPESWITSENPSFGTLFH